MPLAAAALALSAPSALAPAAAAAGQPIVTAPAGALAGDMQADVRIFRGVPFAGPPVGPNRWRPPVAAPTWRGVRDATRFGPACIQPPSRPGSIYAEPPTATSEDCLSLNIWAPAKAQKVPVFVWIHGGSLTTGSGSQAMYDGAALARRGLIVVTINYRIGVLGYLAHPALSTESRDGVSGNYGLLDQIEALRWIRRNIAAFGGDPSNVTIAGESAGALSVTYLMASPAARGLFARAVAQSAYLITTPELRTRKHGLEAAEDVGVRVATALGTGNFTALRALPAERIRAGATNAGYVPFGTVDGRILPDQLVDIFDRGDQARVPVLSGFNTGEIRTLRFLLPPLVRPGDYAAAIERTYGPFAQAYLARYPEDNVEESLLAGVRDAVYGWSAQRLAASQYRLAIPSYLYMFDHAYASAEARNLHAFHAAEIPFVFDTHGRTAPLWPAASTVGEDAALTEAMMSYWASFARDGRPRAAGEAIWQPYKRKEDYLHLAGRPRMATRPLGDFFALHEAVVCRRRAAGGTPWNWNVASASPPLPPEAPRCH